VDGERWASGIVADQENQENQEFTKVPKKPGKKPGKPGKQTSIRKKGKQNQEN
jgi:hypothetical protein